MSADDKPDQSSLTNDSFVENARAEANMTREIELLKRDGTVKTRKRVATT